MIYGDFPSIPLILVITLKNMKTLFCVFLCFRDIFGLKLTWDFPGVNILPREAPGREEVNKTRPRGKMSIGGVSPWPGCATLAYLGLEPPLPYTFISRRSS
jgi:energy-converting hydrogenase Eha subunit F